MPTTLIARGPQHVAASARRRQIEKAGDAAFARWEDATRLAGVYQRVAGWAAPLPDEIRRKLEVAGRDYKLAAEAMDHLEARIRREGGRR